MGQTPQPPRGITLPKPTKADMQAPLPRGSQSDATQGKWGPDIPMGQEATGGVRWHLVTEAECSLAGKFNMLGGFGHSPPSHPFPSPARCPQGAVTGKPTGELAALPPYLRVVCFKGIAVIR